jgi:hypothetical protein
MDDARGKRSVDAEPCGPGVLVGALGLAGGAAATGRREHGEDARRECEAPRSAENDAAHRPLSLWQSEGRMSPPAKV